MSDAALGCGYVFLPNRRPQRGCRLAKRMTTPLEREFTNYQKPLLDYVETEVSESTNWN